MADANELLEPPKFIFLVLSETNFNFVCVDTVFLQILIEIQIFCVFMFLVALAWLNLIKQRYNLFPYKKNWPLRMYWADIASFLFVVKISSHERPLLR